MAYATDKFYRSFEIIKSSGEPRKIHEPLPDLKFVQHWILNNILINVPVSDYAKAYVKKRDIKHNARFHRSQNVVVTMDICNFFPSINVKEVARIFIELGYSKNTALFIAYLCCYKNVLPQGAPTSPYISNLRLRAFDLNVATYTKKLNIRYTRYADDMTFSGDFNSNELISRISDFVYEEGFQINANKTRVARKNARQEVTGIVVNDHMQTPKEYRKKIRQEVYFIQKFGIESHLEFINEKRANYINHLLGKINHALFVNPRDNEMKKCFEIILAVYQNLNSEFDSK